MDATIIEAPSSTKNRTGERDPEMHQTKKGNQWHFGMKAHIGVDSGTGVVHSMTDTAANAHDVTQTRKLLRGGDASGESTAAGAWEPRGDGGEGRRRR